MPSGHSSPSSWNHHHSTTTSSNSSQYPLLDSLQSKVTNTLFSTKAYPLLNQAATDADENSTSGEAHVRDPISPKSPFSLTHVINLTPQNQGILGMGMMMPTVQRYRKHCTTTTEGVKNYCQSGDCSSQQQKHGSGEDSNQSDAKKVSLGGKSSSNGSDKAKDTSPSNNHLQTLESKPLFSTSYISITYEYEIQFWNLQNMDLVGKLMWRRSGAQILGKKRKRDEEQPEEESPQEQDSSSLISLDQLIVQCHSGIPNLPDSQQKIFLLFPVLHSQSHHLTLHIAHLQEKRVQFSLKHLFRDRAHLSFLFRMQHYESEAKMDDSSESTCNNGQHASASSTNGTSSAESTTQWNCNLVACNTLYELCIFDMNEKQVFLKTKPKEEHAFLDHLLIVEKHPSRETVPSAEQNWNHQRIHILSAQCISFEFDTCQQKEGVIQAYETSIFEFEQIILQKMDGKIKKSTLPVEYEGDLQGVCLRIKRICDNFFLMHTNAGCIYRCEFLHKKSKVKVYECIELIDPILQYSLFNFDVSLRDKEGVIVQGTSQGNVVLHHIANVCAQSESSVRTLPLLEQKKKKSSVLSCKMESCPQGESTMHSIVAALQDGTVLRFSNAWMR